MHPLNVTYLVFGLLLIGVSGLWLADQAGWVTDSRYLFPILLIGVGTVSLLAFAARGLVGARVRRETELPTETHDTDTHDTDEEALR